MLISEILEDENIIMHNKNTSTHEGINPTISSSSTFWGVKVSQQQPVTVNFHNDPSKRLHVSQVTLGHLCVDDMKEDRTFLSCKIGDSPEVFLCCLRLNSKEMISLPDVKLGGPGDIVFAADGPRELHIIGFLYDDPSVTLETIANKGGIAKKIQQSSSKIFPENDHWKKGQSCKVSGSEVPLFRRCPPLTYKILSLSNLHGTLDKVEKWVAEINRAEQASRCNDPQMMEGDQHENEQGTIWVKRKLDNDVLHMRDPCQKTVTLEEVTHTDPVVEKIDIQVEETVEERVEQDTIQVTSSEHEPIEERVEQDATQVTSSKQDKSGTMRDKEKRSKRKKRHSPSDEQMDGDNGEGSLSPPPPLDSGELEKLKKKTKYIAEDDDISDKEKSWKRKKRHAPPSDEQMDGEHDEGSLSPPPLLDSGEVEKLKKKKKKKQHISEDDYVIRKSGKSKKEIVECDPNRAANDPSQIPALETREVANPKKQIAEDGSLRSTRHGRSEEPGVCTTRQAKKAKKHSEKIVKDEGVKPLAASSEQQNTEPEPEPVTAEEHLSGTAGMIVCGLAALSVNEKKLMSRRRKEG
ncbi:peptidyl-prolyl cis-trans isomerase FKBP43 isoform X2 [Beta vulgaris subsp. vulgaris]|uniref:peptidyl-prolyl cis-trans isomerase FKBP43 isoform X2 n=1 Tax=Beta vulgaris subsp. vulgaris TaxID=3555 RepID=UPI0020373ADA|nr:peptidyl-prolyl cis-trans isomerase FKBP43 isoform X2 [Beta vulgaris subsp. vulgaris]